MGLRERYRRLPSNPLRQGRRDVLIGLAGAVISGMDAVAGVTRRVTLPEASDRTRVLRVVDRQTVAHDENVVALTFSAADGEPLPRWHPGAHIDVQLPSGRLRQYSLCGDPDLGRRVPHCGAQDSRRRWRFHRGARRPRRRCDGDDARPAQRVPADRARLRLADKALPVRRGRHRDHPDPADAGSGAAPRRRLVDGLRRTHARQPAVPRRRRSIRRQGAYPHRRRHRAADSA